MPVWSKVSWNVCSHGYDPLGTSAWNRLFYVKKLWLLFSPETTADILGLHDRHWQSAREEVIEQMRALYPTIKCNSWPQDCQPLVVFQYPGDVVYGRSGW